MSAKHFAETPNSVNPASLPHSLRHMSKEDAAEDARCLATFLREVSSQFLTREDFSKDSLRIAQGMFLVFNLVLDKLEISTGEYELPTANMSSVIPPKKSSVLK